MPLPNNASGTDRSWMRYMGLATQFFISIGLSLVVGWKLDKMLHFKSPLLIWIMPLLIIIFTLVKLIRETNNKQK